MINNLSGHGVQDYLVNQQASQTTQTAVTKDEKAPVEPLKESTESPSTIVTLGTTPDIPVTYSTAGGIDKPPP